MLPLQEHEDRESAPRRTHTSYGPARLLIRHGPQESLVLALGCSIVLTFSRGNAGLNRARIWTQRANQDKQTFSDRLSAERLKPFTFSQQPRGPVEKVRGTVPAMIGAADTTIIKRLNAVQDVAVQLGFVAFRARGCCP